MRTWPGKSREGLPGYQLLVSAFATRGLCADVLRHVLAEHELIVAEVVLRELRKAMRVKLKLPAATIAAVEELLRESGRHRILKYGAPRIAGSWQAQSRRITSRREVAGWCRRWFAQVLTATLE